MTDNHNTEETNQAVDSLHELLKNQTRLANELAEQNRLERLAAEQKQQEIDLRGRQIAKELEAEKRREARLNEVLNRLTRSDEQMREYVAKLVTTDDAFGETVQRIIEEQRHLRAAVIDMRSALIDNLRASYAMLSRNNDDARQTRPIINSQLELLQYQDNLERLKLDAAKHGPLDVPLKLQNEIAATESRIEELTARIAAQKGGA